MAYVSESNTYPAGVYQLETSDPVQGGASGIDNEQAKNLACRTNYLKDRLDAAMPNRVITAVSADYTILTSDHMIHVTTGASDRTMTLPAASSVPTMRGFRIKKVDSGAGKVLFTADGRTVEINRMNDCVWVMSNGTTWEVVVARAYHRKVQVSIVATGAYTWNVPADVQEVMVMLKGGGGNGAASTDTDGHVKGGGGGGEGATIPWVPYTVVPGGTVTGIVGAAATDTTFGTLTAGKGANGSTYTPGLGGTATVNSVVYAGQPGDFPNTYDGFDVTTAKGGRGGGEGGKGGGGKGGDITGGGGTEAGAAGLPGFVLIEYEVP